jgi:hypothetical protein
MHGSTSNIVLSMGKTVSGGLDSGQLAHGDSTAINRLPVSMLTRRVRILSPSVK